MNDMPFKSPEAVGDTWHDMKTLIVEPILSDHNKRPADFERVLLALQSLNAGTWTLDISTSSLLVCNRCKQIVPVFNERNVKASRLHGLIAAGYDKKIMQTISLALQTASPFDVEVPMVVKNSSPKWLRITGIGVFNNQNSTLNVHGTVEDISERKNMELLKQDILAMVSHDLRSPLSAIKLYLQTCSKLAENSGNNVISEMLEKAGLQIHKMNSMIQCYLDSAAMESGKINHFPTWFDIKELLKEVIADLYILNPGRILFLKPGPCIPIWADREKIAQVLQNLLTNAIKYSSAVDVIVVHFGRVGNCLQVAVKDRGIGIKTADREKIFDRFYRVDCENVGAVKGYGIGLYLSKEIIKQHKGDIWMESEGDKGSKFYFTLPLS